MTTPKKQMGASTASERNQEASVRNQRTEKANLKKELTGQPCLALVPLPVPQLEDPHIEVAVGSHCNRRVELLDVHAG